MTYSGSLKKDPAAEVAGLVKGNCSTTVTTNTATFTEGKTCTTTNAVAKCVYTTSATDNGETFTITNNNYYFGELYRDKTWYDLSKSLCTTLTGTWTEIVAPLATWDLSGTYTSACYKEGDDYRIDIYDFTSLGVTTTITNYGTDTTCATANAQFKIEATQDYKLGVEASLTGFRKINFTAKTATATLLSDSAVTSFNAASMFTYTDWAKDTAKDIIGKKSQTTVAKAEFILNAIDYDIIKLDGKTITGGKTTDTLDGTTEAKRPIEAEVVTATKP